MENPLDILLAAAERAAGPHTGDGQDLDDELDLEELAVTEGAAVFVDGGIAQTRSLSLSLSLYLTVVHTHIHGASFLIPSRLK